MRAQYSESNYLTFALPCNKRDSTIEEQPPLEGFYYWQNIHPSYYDLLIPLN